MIGKLLILSTLAVAQGLDHHVPSIRCAKSPHEHLLLPHENDCTKFYYCEYGFKVIPARQCPGNTEFSVQDQVCVHPEQSKCSLPGPPDSNEESSSEEGSGGDDPEIPSISRDDVGILPNGCPSDFHIHKLLAHEEDCTKFYYCVFGEKELRSCPPKTAFNYDIQVCDHPENVNCTSSGNGGANNNSGENTSPGNNGENGNNSGENGEVLPNGCPSDWNVHLLLPHESKCDKYYSCVFGEKVEMPCGPGTLFNPELQVCDHPENVNCTSSGNGGENNNSGENTTPGNSGENTTPGNSGENGNNSGENGEVLPNGCPSDWNIHLLLPHESKCDKYYSCVFGEKVVMPCAPGTLFNTELQVCDHPENVNCTNSGNSGENTTPSNSGENTTPGNSGEITTPSNSGENTTPGNSGEITTPSNSGENTTPGNSGENTTPGNSGEITTPSNSGDNTTPGNSSEITTPSNSGENTTSGNSGENTTPGNSGEITTPSNSGENTTPGNSGEITTPSTTPGNSGENGGTLPNGCPSDWSVHLLLPHESKCDKYYSCVFGEKVEMPCGPGTLFNPELQVCDHPENVNCTSSGNGGENNNSGENTTPSNNGENGNNSGENGEVLPNGCPSDWNIHLLLPHESKCDKYYSCVFGEKVEMPCAPGTLFNTELQVCDHPENVNCTNSGNSGENTTPGNSGEITTPSNSGENTTPGNSGENTTPGNSGEITTPSNSGENTTPGNSGEITTPSNSGENTTPGNSGENTTPGNSGEITTPSNSGENTTPGNSGEITTPSNSGENTTPGNSGEITTPSNSGENTTPGNSGEITTPSNSGENTTPGNSGENTTPGNSGENGGILPNGCPSDWHIHLLLPHESECDKYYSCVFGEKVEMPCGPGTLFNPELQVCDHPENVNCTNSGNSGENNNSAENTTPGSSSENTTPSNSGENTTPGSSSENTTPSNSGENTTPGSSSENTTPSNSGENTTPGSSSENTTPSNSGENTTPGSSSENTTPSNSGENTTPGSSSENTTPSNSGENTTPGSSSENTTPGNSGENGGILPNGCPSDWHIHLLLPHESECDKYYSCVFGEKMEMPCAPGTLFNPELQVCDHPENVNCTNSGNSGENNNSAENTTPGSSSENTTPSNSGENTTPGSSSENTTPSNSGENTTPGSSSENTTPSNSGENTTPGSSSENTTPDNSGEDGGDNGSGSTEDKKCTEQCNVLPWAHELNCDKFWRCDGNKKVLGVCSEGLHFNVETHNCDFICNAKCVRDGVQSTAAADGLKLFVPWSKVDETAKSISRKRLSILQN